jgi:hypothetical protein
MYTLLGKDEQEGEQTEGFERAIGRLEDAMRTYKKTGGRGLIDELAMKREELLHAMAQTDSEIPDVLACRQMEEGRRQFGEWSPQMAAREQELLEEGIFQCEQLNEQEKEIALKQAQYDVIADLEVKTPESEEVQKPEGSYGWLWLAAGCFLGSIVLGIMVSPFGFAVALLGLICLWMNTKRERAMQQKYQQDVRQAKKKRQEAFLLAKAARAEELSHRAKVIATMKEENQRLEADIRGQLARYHMEESHNLMTTFVMLKEALLSYGQMACHQEEEREERKAQLTAQLSRVEAQLAEAKERYEELELTKELLLEAKKRYASRYLEKARRRFAVYQEQVFGEAKAEITTELTIRVVEDGFVREVDYYSEGTKDLLVLCARLALVDAMFEGEVPFLLLDDAFNELDENHQQAAMRVLHAVAAERQVVCFSCRNIAKQ